MSLVDEKSCLCVKSELDIHSVPPTQTSIEHGSTVDYHPIAATLDGGPIEFAIPGTGEDYLDLASSYLRVSLKVRKSDGSDIAADEKVGPVNLMLHSLFQQVDIYLNDKLVSSSSNTYAYRAYIETVLNYGRGAKETQLTASGWYKDTAGAFDNVDMTANGGLKKRANHTSASKTVDLVGRLHSDVFFQEKLLLNGVGMRIKLTRSKDEFVLLSGENDVTYKVSLTKAELRVRKVRVAPAVMLAHAKALEHAPAKYPINRVECKTFSISQGSLQANQENIFMGQIPSRVIVALVEHTAFNGSYKMNPFNFQHFKLTKISLQVDGLDQHVKPIHCNFHNKTFMEAYLSLLTGTRKAFKDEDVDVSRDEYENGYTLFCFDLSPDLGESDHYSLVKTGSLRLGLNFGAALPSTINAIVYAEFQNVLEIDRNRNVFFDFAA